MKQELHDRIDTVLPAWEELFRSDPEASPFTSPGGARAWTKSWLGSGRPWIIAVREDGQLTGLAPFVISRRGPFRTLSQLGGHPQRDVLALPDARQQAVEAVAAEVVRRRGEWDLLAVNCFPGDSRLVASLLRQGLHSHCRRRASYPGLALPETFDEYLAALPRKRRKDLRRHLRRIEEGVLEVRQVHGADAIAASVARWQELKVTWWDTRGARIHADQRGGRFAGFLNDVMSELVPAGLAEIWELHHSGNVVGVEMSLLDRRTFYSWEGGYDPAVAHLGPGKVAIGEAIRVAIAGGRRYFDLMRGGQDYKYWYGACDREAESLVLASNRPGSRAAQLVVLLRERLRRRRGSDESDEEAAAP
jgi:CelD/BcsL family acetyltransferase involved in cellulose biosynthesis